MRLFVAVPVPGDVRRALADAVADWRAGRARHGEAGAADGGSGTAREGRKPPSGRGAGSPGADGWRWTRPEGWHVTVAFLGQVPDGDVERVAPAVRAGIADASPFVLRLGGLGRFGARVLHVAVEDEPPGALATLGRHVQAAVAAAGLPVQEREVRGHLTMARSTRRARIDHVPAIDVPDRSWRAETVHVEVSRPQRGGARYETLASVPLE
jgi:RNA 2',3'-cyclic 3'-phosphodiesterase